MLFGEDLPQLAVYVLISLAVGGLAYETVIQTGDDGRGVARIFEVSEWQGDIVVNDPDGITLQAHFFPAADAIALVESTLPWAHMRDPLLAYLRQQVARGHRFEHQIE